MDGEPALRPGRIFFFQNSLPVFPRRVLIKIAGGTGLVMIEVKVDFVLTHLTIPLDEVG